MEDQEAGKRGFIVLVPFCFQGHMTPMLQLGTMLHSKGFSIIVAHTEFNSPDAKNHPDFLFLPLFDGLSGYDTSFWNLLNVISEINNNCKAPLREFLAQMMGKEIVACIIYDCIMHFAEDVANSLAIPSIILNTSSPSYCLAQHITLQLQAQNHFPVSESQLLEPVPSLDLLRYKDLPHEITSEIPEVIDFVRSMINIRSSKAVIWNTVEDIEYPVLLKLQVLCEVPFFSIGPFHKMAPSALPTSFLKEDTECIPWLMKQAPKSVLYVSFGSMVTMDTIVLTETAWGLVNSKQPFLWVVRPFSGIEELSDDLRAILGERGHLVEWAPQKEVLAHFAVGGFWSHCGWNSTLESICEGVPMICTPSFADQKVNARKLIHVWEIGLEMDNGLLERGVIERAIRTLMVDEEGKAMRRRVLDLKQKLCMETSGGSSFKSFDNLTKFITSFPEKK